MAIKYKGNGKYTVIVHLGYNADKRLTRTKTFDLSHLSEKQAEKRIVILEEEFTQSAKGLIFADEDAKFSDFVEFWFESVQLRPKTIASYDGELQRRILPRFGHMKIGTIRPAHLVKFYSDLEGKVGSRTIKYQHQILSSIFGKAVLWQVVRENPCHFVSSPKIEKNSKPKHFSDDEAIRFLEEIRTEKLKYICAAELALLGGLRREEILGLDVNDITKDGVSICRTSKTVDKRGMVVEEIAKNDSSIRTLTLDAGVMKDLRKLRAEQLAASFKLQNLWQSDRVFLFTQDNGKPMYGGTLTSWFRDFANKHGFKQITFHGLRHTNASVMIYLGVDIRAGAARLGHAQTSTFLNVYGHMMERADKEISDKLGDALMKGR